MVVGGKPGDYNIHCNIVSIIPPRECELRTEIRRVSQHCVFTWLSHYHLDHYLKFSLQFPRDHSPKICFKTIIDDCTIAIYTYVYVIIAYYYVRAFCCLTRIILKFITWHANLLLYIFIKNIYYISKSYILLYKILIRFINIIYINIYICYNICYIYTIFRFMKLR